MKNKLLRGLLTAALCAIACLSLAACGPFEGYDDDQTILNTRGSSTVGAVENHNKERLTFSAVTFNGVKAVKNDAALPENPVFTLEFELKEGRCKLILIKDGAVHTVTEESVNGTVAAEVPAGSYDIKLVGENAKLELTFYFTDYKE
ncbi:MAG: hypothetical protein LBH24_00035 [Clostridiales bacterium]|jgi:hypothetical protein|nr:hypothetical protein [Clostridiales bacterium]